MVPKLVLALALVVGASSAWAGQSCPREAQQAAYMAMVESTAAEQPSEVTAETTTESAEPAVEAADLTN